MMILPTRNQQLTPSYYALLGLRTKSGSDNLQLRMFYPI